MDAVARYALTGAVVASALGGIVLCALILNGLAPPEEDEFGPLARRRVFAVRIGHSIAAVCFAVTALLVVIHLSRVPRVAPRAAEVERLNEEIEALRGRLDGVERVLERVGAAVDELAGRLDPSASPGSPGRAPAR